MADDDNNDLERVATPDNTHPAPGNREEAVPDPPATSRDPQSKNEVRIKVFLLDGKDTTITCERKVKAADVIERIHTEEDTGEKDFFSLFFFVDKQTKIFLDPEKTVLHQIPRDKRGVQPWILNYGVKFYLPDPANLKEDFSRYLYALQICKDIRDKLISIANDHEKANRLTVLMLQATLGDYDPETHKQGYTDDFEDFLLLPKESRPSNYEAQLIELHKFKAGYTPAQAEREFCDIAKELPRYGYHLFGVQDELSTLLCVANGFHGIKIYRDKEQIHFFKWQNLVKISYKRRKFRIKYYPLDAEGMPDTDTIKTFKYHCGKQPASKRVWKNAVEQHTFFRLSEVTPPTRLTVLFRRGSRFRYSGRTLRQTEQSGDGRKQHNFQRSYSERAQKSSYECYAPGYIPARESFRRQPGIRPAQQPAHRIFIEREDPQSQRWTQRDESPVESDVDSSKFEQQRVQVNFSVKDGVPEDQYKAVLRRSGGSMEMMAYGDEKAEPSYRLSVVDQNSQAVLTSVSLRVDPEEGAELGSHGDSAVVFDSANLPSVKLNAGTTTSTTVIESTGKTLSTGGVTQSYQYTSMEANAEAAVPVMAQDDSPETIEVELFMKQEGELLKEVLSAGTSEGKAEIED